MRVEAQFETSSAEQTKKLAKTLIKEWILTHSSHALVVGFEGDLGSGKTTFIQGAAQALGIRRRVASPTFVLMKRYEISRGRSMYHIDCYRLKSARDLSSLRWKEIVKDSRNIIFLEWSDRVEKALPRNTKIVRFHTLSPRARSITVDVYR